MHRAKLHKSSTKYKHAAKRHIITHKHSKKSIHNATLIQKKRTPHTQAHYSAFQSSLSITTPQHQQSQKLQAMQLFTIQPPVPLHQLQTRPITTTCAFQAIPLTHIAPFNPVGEFGSVISFIQTRRHSTGAIEGSDEDRDHGAYEKKAPKCPEDALTINVVDRQLKTHVINCKVGDNILELMRLHSELTDPNIWLEGSCEKSLACSTCHIILDDKTYNLLQTIKEATEQEEDMLDMAACLSPTSRLGCQIYLTKEMDGATITLPKFSRNMYIDGHIPQPH